MIVCVWLPHFALRVIAHQRASLADAVALATMNVAHPTVLDCSASARGEGVRPGMLVSRAMGQCGTLQVLDYDEARVELAGEQFLSRLESLGAAVHPMEPGRTFFAARPLERLHDGVTGIVAAVQGAFPRARKVHDGAPALRVGVGPNPFVAWVAARYAPDGGHLVIEQHEAGRMLAELPLSLLPADDHMLDLLRALGLRTLGEFAGIQRAHVSDRFGTTGLRLWELAHGDDPRILSPRQPGEPVEETIAFPEPIANLQTLERAVQMLASRAVQRSQFVQHAPRTVVIVAWLATGGSWQVRRVLRVPTVDPERIALASMVQLDEIPAPIERLTLRFDEFELREATQRDLLSTHTRTRELLQAGVRHVQAALGDDAMLQVLEVEPWSRVPERHAVLVPRQQSGPEPRDGDAGRGVYA